MYVCINCKNCIIPYPGFPQYLLLKQFGVCLNQCEPENSAEILSDVWLKVAQIKDSQNYLCVAEVWAEFISKHFAVNILFFNLFKNYLAINIFHSHFLWSRFFRNITAFSKSPSSAGQRRYTFFTHK